MNKNNFAKSNVLNEQLRQIHNVKLMLVSKQMTRINAHYTALLTMIEKLAKNPDPRLEAHFELLKTSIENTEKAHTDCVIDLKKHLPEFEASLKLTESLLKAIEQSIINENKTTLIRDYLIKKEMIDNMKTEEKFYQNWIKEEEEKLSEDDLIDTPDEIPVE